MDREELIKLRFEALDDSLGFEKIKQFAFDSMGIYIKEDNIGTFLKNTSNYDVDKLLFNIELIAYKKLRVYHMRDEEKDKLIIELQKRILIDCNNLDRVIDNENMTGLDKYLVPCYVNFGERFVTIKLAEIRSYSKMELTRLGLEEIDVNYYHCTIFKVDKITGLTFLFYNDVRSEDTDKLKALTEKKKVLYDLFNGSNRMLSTFDIHEYLTHYIVEYLDERNHNIDNKEVNYIETRDPRNTRNNLASGEDNGRHSQARLTAIRDSLDEGQWVHVIIVSLSPYSLKLKGDGSITLLNYDFFTKEVIINVCSSIFTEYTPYTEEEEQTG